MYKKSVLFTGLIEDRTALYSWYNRAKVFCLTSRSECFSLVYPEALFYGNFIITTDVYPSKEIVPFDGVGWIVDSKTDLSDKIQRIIDEKIDIASTYELRVDHSFTFRWTRILSYLHERIEAC